MESAWPYRTALVTGASSGIGAALAQELAQRGCDLVLVARSEERLQQRAETLRATHGHRVEVVATDLTKGAPGSRLASAVAKLGMEIDLLVNNAGFASSGSFAAIDARREREEIALNATAVVDVSHAFLPDMLAAGRGAILNMASLAAFQAVPYMTVYAATKAFVLSFSTGLWAEVHDRGVHVMAVCPGPVNTPFFASSGQKSPLDRLPGMLVLEADAVARGSVEALLRKQMVYTPGAANRLQQTISSPLVPRSLMARVAARMLKHEVG
ncbi:MAG TPA: SDR family oxidoreductase [Nevskiaceae bacterium]